MKTPGMFYFRNNDLLPSNSLELIDFDNVASIYEVIRIIDGIPLFWEKHLERFEKSAGLANESFNFNLSEITANIAKLASANHLNTGNVKLVFTFNSTNLTISSGELFIFFIPHNYPDDIDYQTGVKLISLIAERPNPNAKIHHADLRNQANELIANEKVFEVLLVNHDGFVTEGSRSNVFFISKAKVVTPPLNIVLPGITRELLIDLMHDRQIDFEEQMIQLSHLNKFDAAFVTGTSPKVLPIAQIDAFRFNPNHEILKRMMVLYDQLILDYLETHRI
jgi:branched-chain amino acid aminotransferase